MSVCEENNTGSNINKAYRCAVSQIVKPFSLYICKHCSKLTFFSVKSKIHMSFLVIKKIENSLMIFKMHIKKSQS